MSFPCLAENMGINLVSIPSMRWRERTFSQSDTEVDLVRVYRNFKTKVDSLVFLGCECKRLNGQVREAQAMTSYWTAWKMFCRLSQKLGLNNEHIQVASLPNDLPIVEDVRMGGFKYQFEVGCLSCAFGKPMPDAKYPFERMHLRPTSIRVQDFPHAASCLNHVHVDGCSVRRSSATGLETLIRMIAAQMDVRVVLGQYEE